jgi:hypothetical protein
MVLAAGCGGAGAKRQVEGKAVAPYPFGLSAQSSPTQVAQVLIRALDEDNERVLEGLVAVKHEIEAIDAIYRKHGKAHETSTASAAAMTVSGWKTSYAWYEPGATHVRSERVGGETATVEAEGLNSTTGRRRELTITMVKEDGVWKVAAGLQAREL